MTLVFTLVSGILTYIVFSQNLAVTEANPLMEPFTRSLEGIILLKIPLILIEIVFVAALGKSKPLATAVVLAFIAGMFLMDDVSDCIQLFIV